jgi:hypothetical protein
MAGLVLGGALAATPLGAACTGCTNFAAAVNWGTVAIANLKEASGIASSRRNPGVLWTHNDGARQNVYAVNVNGERLATFDLKTAVDDVEDVAVGPGPVAGIPYLYFGDMGGSKETNNVRARINLLRMPEPLVDLAWAAAARATNFTGVETFTLAYPDGSYDAESLLVDPRTADILVVTKQTNVARVYRANLAGVKNHATVTLEFVHALAFSVASGGDISADGAQIILRRENFAMLWQRCDGETLAAALAREGVSVPILGPPGEPNGEGIGFLADGTGYVTISEGTDPTLHFFAAQCPTAPQFALPLLPVSGLAGGTAAFQAVVTGFPAPALAWRFDGNVLEGQTNATLVLTNLALADAGTYLLVASNASGVATSMAALVVRIARDLRITEVQSVPSTNTGVAKSDWWELTNFEPQPVNLAGWRFNDSIGGLNDAVVIGANVTIGPGETMVFVEGLTPTQFRNWWGATNLPAGLKIITYSGTGIGLGAGGDSLRLWSSTATLTNDTVAQVDFGAASPGVTFNYDPVTGVFGGASTLGVNGVVRAAAASDLGSPGSILAPLAPTTLQATQDGSQVRIAFAAAVGRRYALEARNDLAADPWELTGDTLTATNNGTAFFELNAGPGGRYFRVLAK